jgi:hypothetical protein
LLAVKRRVGLFNCPVDEDGVPMGIASDNTVLYDLWALNANGPVIFFATAKVTDAGSFVMKLRHSDVNDYLTLEDVPDGAFSLDANGFGSLEVDPVTATKRYVSATIEADGVGVVYGVWLEYEPSRITTPVAGQTVVEVTAGDAGIDVDSMRILSLGQTILHGDQPMSPSPMPLPPNMTGDAIFCMQGGGDFVDAGTGIGDSVVAQNPVPMNVVLETGADDDWTEIGRVAMDWVDRYGGPPAKFRVASGDLGANVRFRADAEFEAFKGTMGFVSAELLYNGDAVHDDGMDTAAFEGTHGVVGGFHTKSSFVHGDLPKTSAVLTVPDDHRKTVQQVVIVVVAPRRGVGVSFMHVDSFLEKTSEVDGDGNPINWSRGVLVGDSPQPAQELDISADEAGIRYYMWNARNQTMRRFYRLVFEEAAGSPGTDGTFDYALVLASGK